MFFWKGGCKMKHSVRAYLERLPMEKLKLLVDNDSFEENYGVNVSMLQDILEVLMIRNEENQLSTCIQKIQDIQRNRNGASLAKKYN